MLKVEKKIKDILTYCRFCLGSCGLVIKKNDDGKIKVKGDKKNPHSKGYICRKGANIAHYYNSTSRINKYYVRNSIVEGDFFFKSLSEKLKQIIKNNGPNSVGVYFGTHAILDSSGIWTGMSFLFRINSQSFFTVASIDNIKKIYVAHQVTRGANPGLINIADISNADLCLIVGTNPVRSNGHLYSNINFKNRLKEHRNSGRFSVCLDPSRTETAKTVNLHLQLKPNTDYIVLAFFVKCILDKLDEKETRKKLFLKKNSPEITILKSTLKRLSLSKVASLCDIEKNSLSNTVEKLLKSSKISFMSGTGVSFSETGIITEQLLYMLCALKDSFGSKKGNGFLGCVKQDKVSDELRFSSFTSKILSNSKVARENELPCSAFKDLVKEKKIRALIVFGGNPVASFPSDINAALSSLDVLVTLNTHHDQTTKLANYICPVAGQLERADSTAYVAANIASGVSQYTDAVFPVKNEIIPAWKFFSRLGDMMGLDVTKFKKSTDEISTDNVINSIRGFNSQCFKTKAQRNKVRKLNLVNISLNRTPNLLPQSLISELKDRLSKCLNVFTKDENINSQDFTLVSGRLNDFLNSAKILKSGTHDENQVFINDQDYQNLNITSISTVQIKSVDTGKILTGKLYPTPDIKKKCLWIPQSDLFDNVSSLCNDNNVCKDTAMAIQTGYKVSLKVCF